MDSTAERNGLTLTALCARSHWNKKLIEQLLVEADEIPTRDDGRTIRHVFYIERVEAAEKSAIFQAKIKHDNDREQATQERADEIRDSLHTAIDIDLNQLSVPTAGTLDEVFPACMNMMRSYNSMSRIVDMDSYDSVYSPCSLQGRITPDRQLYEAIAAARPDLAFECGKRYQRDLFNHNIF